MERKSVLLVDAFAEEALGGVSLPVVPEPISRTQLRAVAGEFGAPGAVTLEDGAVVYVEREPAHAVAEAAVAGWTGLSESGALDDSEETITVVEADGTEREYTVEAGETRDVRVELPAQESVDADVSLDRLGPALGVDRAAIESVDDELPVSYAEEFGGTLFVPFGFLDGLGGSSPDRETLAGVLAETGTTRVCAFTFDTLSRRADLHVRVFDPSVPACEWATSGVAIAGCGRYLRENNAFDGDIEELRVETGYFLDRPGTVETTLGPTPRVGGRGLTVLDATVAVPEEDDDDIIEV